ncbi:MAG TPA: leucine--tRNA ligase, partial [Candidatus Saccharimonadales bacterium]|nr:leucine--tRNA ligase [Candidatus Saccharimonadales bacterium]
GHTREYTLGDILARHKRMQGYNVLYPMGYDEFGLPTENYAIKNKITPQEATRKNVSNFQKQFESLGLSIDWARKVNTSDPDYYKWTQWLFLQFFKKGLAYQDEIAINWCPHCKTGLANEEVVNGRHERCDTLVEKKTLKQWMLKITKYADRLIEGLKDVDYPSRIADQQINWIGRKEGIDINYEITDAPNKEIITCFTTRPDTNFGATFVVLAPEHPFVQKIVDGKIKTSHRETVINYVKKSLNKSEIERQEEGRKKTGAFTGFHAKNELTGKDMPIWVSDFVLAGFGTGAVVGVPGHDLRDFEFANEFDLPVIRVVVGSDGDKSEITKPEQVQEEIGTMINSDFLNGMDIHKATQKVMDYMEEKGMGKRKISYRLRDWIFSRQHYWGEPIPIIHCPADGAVAVPDKDLPVVLPEVKNYEPTDTGESPLASVEEWVNTKCPKCGKAAKRETDTMPNWAGSSWYYLRYYDSKNDKAFADDKKLKYWGAVDMYLGGMEHTTLHLLYSRFWHQFFYDQKLVPTPEPYKARRGQGIILAADGSKMSKSIGNVVNPSEVIDSGYGADAMRLIIAFLAPYDQTTPWNPEGVAGTFRFLQRVWTLVQEYLDEVPSLKSQVPSKEDIILRGVTHKAINKVHNDIYDMQFNTAIAALMEFSNSLYKIKAEQGFGAKDDWKFALETILKLLAPFAPHMTEELWHDLGNKTSIHTADWPVHDKKYLIQDSLSIVVQINGKLRANIEVSADSSEAEITETAQKHDKVEKHLKNKKVRKTIYVPGKLINFVV